MRAELKRTLLGLAYPGWGADKTDDDGYTVVVPAPMDMPFLTYFALRGMQLLDISQCREILVVPDGCGSDQGRALADAIRLAGVDKVKMLPVTMRNKATISLFGHSGIAHWMTIIEAIREASTDWLFLHDADAFFTDAALIESNYAICRQEGLQGLGVTARWDPFFQSRNLQIPGTWELFFSAAWARTWRPVDHKAGPRATDDGTVFFDTMLYPLFRDHGSGRVRVRTNDSFVHLSGTVVTYRSYLDHAHRAVGDELFRLLFLSLLQELAPPIASECRLPRIADLQRGLDARDQPVHYVFPDAPNNYRQFRDFVDRLVVAPVFRSDAERIESLLRPFDDHFAGQPAAERPGAAKMRSHGLWLG